METKDIVIPDINVWTPIGDRALRNFIENPNSYKVVLRISDTSPDSDNWIGHILESAFCDLDTQAWIRASGYRNQGKNQTFIVTE